VAETRLVRYPGEVVGNPWPVAGSYVCVRTPGWVGGVIRLATHSDVNHAVVITDDVGGCVEAEPGGARRGHLAEYAGRLMYSCTEGSVAQRQIVARTALGFVGAPYDDLDIADLGLEALGLPWRGLNGLIARYGHGLICSTLTAKAGLMAGLDWLGGRDNPAAVTPADLRDRPGVVRYTLVD
jgi:hypothetical protein